MNLDELEIRPSVKELYRLLGQERIMSFYINDSIVFGKRYVNPFRDDKNAGCYFRRTSQGNIYFVDYATKQVYYNPIDVASLATGYDYPDILYKIESDFKIKNLKLEDKRKLELEAKNFEQAEIKPASIKVTLKKFNKKDLEYWNQFNINETILKFYNVRKVDKAWINDQLWYMDNDIDPCYRYKEKDKFKLYRPFADKRLKFRTNYFGGLLEGYAQLPHKGDILIITKSSKDVMTLHSIGINAVAVRSENTPISLNAYNLLKERFNKMYVWFDPDEAGSVGCQKIHELYKLPIISHDISLGKDPSDIVKEHGTQVLIDLINQKLKEIQNGR